MDRTFLTADQVAVVEAAEHALARLLPHHQEYLRVIFEEQRFPDEVWDEMARAGLLAAMIPEAYGGSGLGLTAMALALETFSRYALANTLVVLTTMDAMAIAQGGTDDQKRRWLPAVADGRLKLAFAVTEPDAGTNTFRIRTLADRVDGGYRLHGQKAWITAVDVADALLVVARTLPHDEVVRRGLPGSYGLALFLVDRATAGLRYQEMPTMGIEGFRQFQVFFDGVDVPEDRRIGAEHEGARLLFYALNPERTLGAAIAVGMSDYCLTRAVAYAKERRVFGDTPIGAYQAVQHPLARLRIQQQAAWELTLKAAAAFDRGLEARTVGQWANMAKYLAAETAFEAVDRAIQTLGGSGFVKDHYLIQMLAPIRLLKTAPINNEMILNYVAENVLGLPRSY
jgi:alkylation response protein AidB-like acyl-CoA dehydrogenase